MLKIRSRCEAVGCHERSDLSSSHQGLFCHRHSVELDLIRGEMEICKQENKLEEELWWRERECFFRRHTDSGHLKALLIQRKQLEIRSRAAEVATWVPLPPKIDPEEWKYCNWRVSRPIHSC